MNRIGQETFEFDNLAKLKKIKNNNLFRFMTSSKFRASLVRAIDDSSYVCLDFDGEKVRGRTCYASNKNSVISIRSYHLV